MVGGFLNVVGPALLELPERGWYLIAVFLGFRVSSARCTSALWYLPVRCKQCGASLVRPRICEWCGLGLCFEDAQYKSHWCPREVILGTDREDVLAPLLSTEEVRIRRDPTGYIGTRVSSLPPRRWVLYLPRGPGGNWHYRKSKDTPPDCPTEGIRHVDRRSGVGPGSMAFKPQPPVWTIPAATWKPSLRPVSSGWPPPP